MEGDPDNVHRRLGEPDAHPASFMRRSTIAQTGIATAPPDGCASSLRAPRLKNFLSIAISDHGQRSG
jgi:hypothetical protein